MKILSIQDSKPLLGGDLPASFANRIRERIPVNAGPFAVPPDSGAKTSLARELAGRLLRDSSLFWYISGWMVWPSSEHFDLFDGYRHYLGEKRESQGCASSFVFAWGRNDIYKYSGDEPLLRLACRDF